MTVGEFLNVFSTDEIVLFTVNGEAVNNIWLYKNETILKVSICYSYQEIDESSLIYEDIVVENLDVIKLPKNCFRIVFSLGFML